MRERSYMKMLFEEESRHRDLEAEEEWVHFQKNWCSKKPENDAYQNSTRRSCFRSSNSSFRSSICFWNSSCSSNYCQASQLSYNMHSSLEGNSQKLTFPETSCCKHVMRSTKLLLGLSRFLLIS